MRSNHAFQGRSKGIRSSGWKILVVTTLFCSVLTFPPTVSAADLSKEQVVQKIRQESLKRMSDMQDLMIVEKQSPVKAQPDRSFPRSFEDSSILTTSYFTKSKESYEWRTKINSAGATGVEITFNPTRDYEALKEGLKYGPVIVTGVHKIFYHSFLQNLDSESVVYQGIQQLDGSDRSDTHVLSVEGLGKLLVQTSQPQVANSIRGTLWVDAKKWVLKKIKLERETTEGNVSTIHSEEIDYINTREEGAVVVPMVTKVALGIRISAKLSEAEKKVLDSLDPKAKEFLGKEAMQSFYNKGQHAEDSRSWILTCEDVKVKAGVNKPIPGK